MPAARAARWLCRVLVAATFGGLAQHAAALAVAVPERSEAQLAEIGPVNGSWHLCTAPTVATRATGKSPIPRILHQTYKSKNLPPDFAMYHDTWVQRTPKWKHRIWLDHENRALVKTHYPWFLETYDAYEHTIQRVDAARVFMLHRYGGVYADMDVEAVRDPSPLFDGGHDLVLFYQLPPRCSGLTIDQVDARSPKLGTVSNAFMASKPGHPFWMFLADLMIKGREEAKAMAERSEIPNMDIYMATGPNMLTNALAEYQATNSDAKVGIFSKKYWSPFTWGLKENPCEVYWECRALFPEAFVVSHWTRSWIRCQAGSKMRLCMPSASLLQAESDLDVAGSWCP